jgi:hypothetical protein
MGHWHLRTRRDSEFKHCDRTVRVGGFKQKTDFDLSNLDYLCEEKQH